MTTARTGFERLVALYPAAWRAAHGEAYLGVMLDVADAERRTGPTAREVLSVAVHAARAWAVEGGRRTAADAALRSLRWPGLAAVASGCVLSVLFTVLGEWVPGIVRTPPTGGFVDERTAFVVHSSGVVVYALWGLVLLLVLLRRYTAVRWSLVTAAIAPVVAGTVGPMAGLLQPAAGQLGAFTVFAATGALLWPATPTRRERAAALVAVALLAAGGITAYYLAFFGVLPYPRPGELLGVELTIRGLSLLDLVVTPAALVLLVVGLLLVWHRPGVLVTAVLVGQAWFVMLHAGTPGYATRVILDTASLPALALGSLPLLALAAGVSTLRAARAG